MPPHEEPLLGPEPGQLPTGYLPRIGFRSYRAVEGALTATPTLLDPGLDLTGGIVEADWAMGEPPLLERLRKCGVPYIADLHTLRFADPAFQLVKRLRELPYAPEQRLEPGSFDPRAFAARALAFQELLGVSTYLAPATPFEDATSWQLNLELIMACVAGVGTEVPARPLVAQLSPKPRSKVGVHEIAGTLADLPLAGVYVQPTRLLPTTQGIETLVRYIAFLHELREAGLQVFAGRAGTFGLALVAVGVDAYDSGLGDAEQFDLASLHASARRSQRQRETGERQDGGPQRRLYVEGLKTTLMAKHAEPLLDQPGVRDRFPCSRGTCRLDGFEGLIDRRREHYLHTKMAEVAAIRAAPTLQVRVENLQRDLDGAVTNAKVAGRFLLQRQIDKVPSFDHLKRWQAVLGRLSELRTAA